MKTKNCMKQSANRVKSLIIRLDEVKQQLDIIHEQLMEDDLNRGEFTELITLRNNLLIEKQNRKEEIERLLSHINEELEQEDDCWCSELKAEDFNGVYLGPVVFIDTHAYIF